MEPEKKPVSADELRRSYEEAQQEPKKPKPPKDWQSRIEEEIAKIDFDKLSNKGRPLNLDRNPYVRPEDEMANDLIRNAGFTLPWIEDGKKIDSDVAAARRDLERAWQETRELRDDQICAGHQWVEGAWQAALRDFRKRVEQINREIRDYNLKVTNMNLHKYVVRVDEELARLGIGEEE